MSEMEYKEIPVEDIEPSPFQVREEFDQEKLKELADSLESTGDIQPVIVREKNNGYQLICGERRWRASKMTELDNLPALVRDTEPENILLESLVENIHREDLTSTERENAVYELWESGEWDTQEELARKLGKSYNWVNSQITAAVKRRKEKIPIEATTRDIIDVGTVLPKEDRERILEKKVKGEIEQSDLREFRSLVKKADEETKEQLLQPGVEIDIETARAMVEEKKETTEEETVRREPTEEEIEEIETNIQDIKEETEETLAKPEVQERKKLKDNWQALVGILNRVDRAFCPVCGDGELKFTCHDLTVGEAKEMARKEYQKSVKGGD